MRMRYLLLFPFVLMVPLLAQSQSFSVENHPDTIFGSPNGTKDLEIEFDVYNNSSTTKKVYAYRTIISEVNGSENQFCWGATCYPPFVDTSQSTRTLLANGGVDSTFIAYYDPQGYAGVTEIEYCFYDSLNPSDETCTVVAFDATNSVGVEEVEVKKASFVVLSSNPITDDLKIGLDLKNSANATLSVHNMLGVNVKEVSLEGKGTEVRIETSDLESGIYFASLVAEGQRIDTKKVVVDR